MYVKNASLFLSLSFSVVMLIGFFTLNARAQGPKVKPVVKEGLAWYDTQKWGIEGKGWDDTKHYFDRLPAKAEGMVRSRIWDLSHHSTGMICRFETNASEIWVQCKLLSEELAMSHMPATGVSGIDLYAQDKRGRWQWLAGNYPESQTIKVRLVEGLDPGMRAYMLYLPLYNGIESLEIGVPSAAQFQSIAPRKQKPIVIYGTSIVHGGCASRPGMAWTAILGRMLDRPVINLGFSSNGTMDAEMGELLSELDAAVYVIDCLPNMSAGAISLRTEPLVRKLRKAHRQTPIVLVEDRTFPSASFRKAARDHHRHSRAALKAAYDELTAEGVDALYYVKGETLLAEDREDTVDGSHLSDLGMLHQATALEKVIRSLFQEK